MQIVVDQLQQRVRLPDVLPQIMGLVPVRVDGILAVLVEGEEAGFLALQVGGHGGALVADGKMHETALERQQRLALGEPVLLVLLLGVLQHLTRERILQLDRDDGQTVEEERHIDGVLVLLAVFELAHDAETIALIERLVFRVHAAGRLEICQLELCAPIRDPFAQDFQHAILADLTRDALEQLLGGIGSVLFFQFFKGLGLCGLDELNDFIGDQTKRLVVLFGQALAIPGVQQVRLRYALRS